MCVCVCVCFQNTVTVLADCVSLGFGAALVASRILTFRRNVVTDGSMLPHNRIINNDVISPNVLT